MAVPTIPAGCLAYSDFYLEMRSGSAAFRQYIYAIVDCSNIPSVWLDYPQDIPRRYRFSRAIAATATHEYNDMVLFYGANNDPYKLAEVAYTTAAGYQAFQESNENYRPADGRTLDASLRDFAVLEFVLWDGVTTAGDTCGIAAVACEAINDLAFDAPGANTRQHVERCPETFITDYFASAYHIQWCLSASINRCIYEDRLSYCWPVFADRVLPPS